MKKTIAALLMVVSILATGTRVEAASLYIPEDLLAEQQETAEITNAWVWVEDTPVDIYAGDPDDPNNFVVVAKDMVKVPYYVARGGETMEIIADFFGVPEEEVISANELRKPYDEAFVYSALVRLPSPDWDYLHNISYVVKPGDTLSEIAEFFYTDVETLQKLNSIEDPDLVYAYTLLKIS